MQDFISGVASSLVTVTTLNLATHTSERLTAAVKGALTQSLSTMLASLAPACPQLQNLVVSGVLSEESVEQFAAHCPHICQLDVEPGTISVHALQQLHQLLPKLHSFTFHERFDFDEPSPGYRRAFPAAVKTAAAALSSCVSLKHLNLACCDLDSSMWEQLPPNLESLCGSSCDAPPATLDRKLRSLLTLKMGEPSRLLDVNRILLMAPNLKSLDLEVDIDCALDVQSPLHLGRLRERLQKGLLVGMLSLTDDTHMTHSKYLSQIQPLPGPLCVQLMQTSPLKEGDCLAELGRAFPGLKTLHVFTIKIFDHALFGLFSCTSLRVLDFYDCDRITPPGVMMMCTKMPWLETVTFHTCEQLDREAVVDLMGLVEMLGLQTKLVANKGYESGSEGEESEWTEASD